MVPVPVALGAPATPVVSTLMVLPLVVVSMTDDEVSVVLVFSAGFELQETKPKTKSKTDAFNRFFTLILWFEFETVLWFTFLCVHDYQKNNPAFRKNLAMIPFGIVCASHVVCGP